MVSVHAQLSTEVITALSEGGIEQKPVTLAGVRRAATLEKLVTIEGALTFPKPPAAILDITGTAEVRELKRMQGKAVAKGALARPLRMAGRGGRRPPQPDRRPALQPDIGCRRPQRGLPLPLRAGAGGLCGGGRGDHRGRRGLHHPHGHGDAAAERPGVPYQLQCVADAFSTRFETTLTPQTLATESLLCALDETTVLRGSGPLPDAGAHI